jgi:hypothetical protein
MAGPMLQENLGGGEYGLGSWCWNHVGKI